MSGASPAVRAPIRFYKYEGERRRMPAVGAAAPGALGDVAAAHGAHLGSGFPPKDCGQYCPRCNFRPTIGQGCDIPATDQSAPSTTCALSSPSASLASSTLSSDADSERQICRTADDSRSDSKKQHLNQASFPPCSARFRHVLNGSVQLIGDQHRGQQVLRAAVYSDVSLSDIITALLDHNMYVSHVGQRWLRSSRWAKCQQFSMSINKLFCGFRYVYKWYSRS